MSARRSWLPFLVAAAVAVSGVVVVVLVHHGSGAARCASSVHAASPLDGPSRFSDDPHVVALASSVSAMGPPFGSVRAGIGYNYGQWLHLYGVEGGALAFTKNNPAVTLLDDASLRARWALRPATKRIAWDASPSRFALVDLADGSLVRVGSYDLADGHERWCVRLTTEQRDGQPVSTAFLDGGDLLVALPFAKGLDVTRLSAGAGATRWAVPLRDVGRADYLAQVGADTFVAGGDESFRLAQGPLSGGGFGVYALGDGHRLARYGVPAGSGLHVVGTTGDEVVALVASGGRTRLDGVGLDGRRRWTTPLPDATVDTTLRGDVVLARTEKQLVAYRAGTGERLWSRPVPQGRTYFPYGFLLGQVPSLDADHVLLPTTTALVALDVRNGRETSYPLPTDGISTTYWPYQLVVTDRLLGVVTNTAGILADRG